MNNGCKPTVLTAQFLRRGSEGVSNFF